MPIKVLLISSLIVLFTLSAQAQLVVKTKPRAPRVVVVKKDRPGPDYIWINGHWKVGPGNTYVWVAGNWVKTRKGFTWVDGRWKRVRGGWKWIPGHWKRR